jgi:hypothetical protein
VGLVSGVTRAPTKLQVLEAFLLILTSVLSLLWAPLIIIPAGAETPPLVATIAPSTANWGALVGSRGDVHIDLRKSGIAVRVEVPREFSAGVVSENDTSFIQSDVRNDYYYYNVVDQSKHWSYAWRGQNSSAPCFKPSSTFYDPHAPWCVEIWNFLNGSFLNFTVPKTVKLSLQAPQIAGVYNFTVDVANHTNNLGLPDFAHSWNETLFVPVTMKDNPGNITGTIMDCKFSRAITNAKGIAYALIGGHVVARAFVDQTTGRFTLSGLDPSIASYDVQASAGLFQEPDGITVAFSLTDGGQVGAQSSVPICLQRAPQISGTLQYRYSDAIRFGQPVPNALTTHPWLATLGFSVLNITVEALDALGTHVYRNYTLSQDSSSDHFTIIMGLSWRYPGVDATGSPDSYGTEYAGLPQSAELSVRAWIAGYNLQGAQSVIVTPPSNGPPNTGSPSNVQLIMLTGSAIVGTLKFNFCPDPCSVSNQQLKPETPLEAESRIAHSQTALVYGGNIIIEAYDSSNLLRGISVINGTNARGAASYSGQVMLPFEVVGFSEWLNRSLTAAGGYSIARGSILSQIPLCTAISNDTFCWKDAALPADTYTLRVYVRGYGVASGSASITIGSGLLANSTTPVNLIEGGAIQALIVSYDNRPKTYALQSVLPWRFLNLSIPVRARVYFYDSSENTVGYAERLMIAGSSVNQTVGVEETTFTVTFAGQDWSLHDILFYGQKPDYLPTGNMSISAFTLGYIQQVQGKNLVPWVSLGELTQTSLALLYGNAIDLSAPLYNDPELLTKVPEHQHVVAEVTGSGLSGAMIENLTAGLPSPLEFVVYGFGGMLLKQQFVGMGHFFYVPFDAITNVRCTNHGFSLTDSNRCFDYGLDKTTYFTDIPEYGFDRHFTSFNLSLPVISFHDLFLEQGAMIPLINMAKVGADVAVVGVRCDGRNIPMSWVVVTAQAVAQPLQTTTTYDGNYSLFIRGGGPYVLTFSLLQLYPATNPAIQLGNVGWGSTYAISPPPMLPAGGTPTCDPSPALATLAQVPIGLIHYVLGIDNLYPSVLEISVLIMLTLCLSSKRSVLVIEHIHVQHSQASAFSRFVHRYCDA